MEPPLAARLERAIAELTCLTANINRDRRHQPEPFQPKDFLIDWSGLLKDPEEVAVVEEQTPEDAMAAMERLRRHQELVMEQQARKKENGG